MNNLLTLSFWFNSRPEPLTALFQNLILVFAILMIALFILTKIITNRKPKTIYHKVWLKLATFSLSNAILGFLLWFFSYEMVPVLSAKFLLGLWGIGIIVWIILIIKQIKKIPQRREQIAKEKEFKKYIP
ncbi:MAG: hypothetical protein V1865_02105 [bacterium]